MGEERLSIGATDVFDNFYFICSQIDEGFENVAGLIGLGQGKLSIVNQTASKYHNVFSSCLPAFDQTGFLSFGTSLSKSPKYIPRFGTSLSKSGKYIPLSSDSIFYSVSLTGIIVNGRRLSIPASVFSRADMIIDSRTTFTQLSPEAYSAFRSAFTEAMSKCPKAKPLPTLVLDTCYDFSKKETISVPSIVLSFNGVDVEIDTAGIFVVKGIAQMCLAVVGNSDARDKVIFGNVQQQSLEVVYDVNEGKNRPKMMVNRVPSRLS